jgi:hypothetical protein
MQKPTGPMPLQLLSDAPDAHVRIVCCGPAPRKVTLLGVAPPFPGPNRVVVMV